MCVLIIMTLIPVRTDSCMRSTFWRQMFSCLVMRVDSNWGKRTVWTMCEQFHCPCSFSFPSLGCLLGRSPPRSHQLLQGSPLSIAAPPPLHAVGELAGGSGQGSELTSTQQHSKQFGDAFHPHVWYQLQAGLDAHAYRQRLISDSPCIC